jgi:hypothetical protein
LKDFVHRPEVSYKLTTKELDADHGTVAERLKSDQREAPEVDLRALGLPETFTWVLGAIVLFSFETIPT